MQTLPTTKSCFVCGRENANGLRLRFETDGTRVQTRITFGHHHIGFQNTIHGGLIATLLDEVMVWACGVRTKRFAYCAEMTVRYSQPLRPGIEALAIGEFVENRRDKIFEARAELRDSQNVVLAKATGKYIPIKAGELPLIGEDFDGDIASVFGAMP